MAAQSNSSKFAQIFSPQAHGGIDTIKVRGHLLSMPNRRNFEKYTTFNSGRPDMMMGLFDNNLISAGADWGDRRAWAGWFEVSLPKYVYGSNLNPLGVEHAQRAIEQVYERMRPILPWAILCPKLTLQRVDVTFDFCDVGNIHQIITGLGQVAVPRNNGAHQWSDRNGHMSGLTRNTKGWGATLYDKGKEIKSRARYCRDPHQKLRLEAEAESVAGTLRYEANIRGENLRKHGDIVKVEDLTQARINLLGYWAFNRAGFDQKVGGMKKVTAALVQCHRDDLRALTNACGAALAQMNGIEPVSAYHRKKDAEALAKAGLCLADFDDSGDKQDSTVWLDLGTQTVKQTSSEIFQTVHV